MNNTLRYTLSLIALFATLAIAGVASAQYTATASSHVGTWDVDFAATMAQQPMSEEERAMAMQIMGDASMQMVFGADNSASMTANMMGQVESETGTWTLVGVDASTVTVTLTSVDGNTANIALVFQDENTVHASEEGETLIMRRSTGEAAPEAAPAPTSAPTE